MNFNSPPPKKNRRKAKKKLQPEDVSEENPKLAEFLRARRKAEARLIDVGEMNFYIVLVAQSEKQKNEFFDNLPKDVNVLYDTYVDLEQMANSLGIEGITPNDQKEFHSRLNKRLTARTGIPNQGTDPVGDNYWGDFFGG